MLGEAHRQGTAQTLMAYRSPKVPSSHPGLQGEGEGRLQKEGRLLLGEGVHGVTDSPAAVFKCVCHRRHRRKRMLFQMVFFHAQPCSSA